MAALPVMAADWIARGCYSIWRRAAQEPKNRRYSTEHEAQKSNCECKNTPFAGGVFVYVRRCPTFPPELGSIIGADRLSFRVRDGTGRFPVAVAAVTLFIFPFKCIDGGCGVDTTIVVDTGIVVASCVGKFSAG